MDKVFYFSFAKYIILIKSQRESWFYLPLMYMYHEFRDTQSNTFALLTEKYRRAFFMWFHARKNYVTQRNVTKRKSFLSKLIPLIISYMMKNKILQNILFQYAATVFLFNKLLSFNICFLIIFILIGIRYMYMCSLFIQKEKQTDKSNRRSHGGFRLIFLSKNFILQSINRNLQFIVIKSVTF